jgi:hypothetical protein
MANFCNKCGSPVSGIFCNKCGADTRLTASPSPPAATLAPALTPQVPAAIPPVPPEPAVVPAPPPVSSFSAENLPAVAKFCNKCGAPSRGTTFCNQCGADLRLAPTPASLPAAIPSVPTPSQPAAVPQTPGKGSPLTKILIGFAEVVITVGALAAGGVYYVVYRVKQKVHEVARNVPGLGSSSDSGSSSGDNSILGSISKAVSGSGNSEDSGRSGSNGGIRGDACRLLSKEEVSRFIGVAIVATQTADGGCSYLAHGNSGDMTAKHMSAMAATKGADAKGQQMVEGFAGGLFKSMQSENHEQSSDSNGNVPVFMFGVDNNSADTQMQLNAKVLGGLGPGRVDISGIGDQAFDEAGAMMFVRKGDKLIRIMYSTCPCGVEAIKPLAKMLADRV